VDAMDPGFQDKIWNLMHERAGDVDALVAVSEFYAKTMGEKMKLPPEKVHTFYLGVDPEDYPFVLPGEKERNIGYISRMSHENGFDIVIDAFIHLKRQPGFEDVKLIVTGGSTGDDSKFIKAQKKKIKANGLAGSFEVLPDFEEEAVHDFFRQVSLLSVPVRKGEAFGMYLLESMASGVPVVQPALGAFPEIVGLTGGGITYQLNAPGKLSEAWQTLLADPRKREELGRKGREGTKELFNIHNHAGEIVGLFKALAGE